MPESRYISLFILYLFLIISIPSQAQKNKSELEKEKTENLNRIQETEEILLSTEKQKAATLGQLNALNAQIRSRESLIVSIQREVNWYNLEIGETELIIESLKSDLENLKIEYGEMLFAGYKASRSQDKLTFLFSSGSFNQLLMRLKYFEQYGKYRRNQAVQIEKVQQILEIEIQGYETKLADKSQLLDEEINEQAKLKSLRGKQNQVVAQLSKQQNLLNRELATRKNAVEEINALIANIIAAERSAATTTTDAVATRLSANFAGNQRKLPWPVDQGFISMGFGRQKHPVLKLIEVNNKGIYIQTQPNEEIKAVFDGRVSAVAVIPGMNKAVIVQHGEYRTVYANLKDVTVKRNQQIKLNDKIGEIYTDGEGRAELYFELWKNNTTLNPQQWLTKK